MSLSKKPYKGCRDFFPVQMRERDYLFSKMKSAAKKFAYEAYDGPMVEEVELYKAKSGDELINEQIYSFTDRGERFVAIRPEMTPTVARMVAQVHREMPKPLRWYSIPNLMRYERPQRGRLREHWQFNVDVFGAPENLGEVEILQVAIELMQSFGANENQFEILLNDRRAVDAIFQNVLKVNDDDAYKLYKIIDKAKKVNSEAMDKMINEVISDSSIQKSFKDYLALASFEDLFTFLENHNLTDTVESFKCFSKMITDLGLAKYIKYDPTIVRGLDYYTGVVFEIFDKHPDNRRAIAGGGAYANLLKIFNETPLPGVGFGMGDVTLADFLKTHKLMPDFSHDEYDLFITYQDETCEKFALDLANTLRCKNLNIETNLGPLKIKKLFSVAEKKGHKFTTIIGTNEFNDQSVEIKKLQSKDSKTFKINQIDEMIDYLKN